MRRTFTYLCSAFIALEVPCTALSVTPTQPDSLTTHELSGVVVDATLQRTSATATTFIPTQQQRRTAQSAVDLLQAISIPQLLISGEGEIQTTSGQAVAVYVDYMIAGTEELKGMRLQDVLRVEYMLYPSDPRFGGHTHVVHFVMAQYKHGGYLKGYGESVLISPSQHLQANLRWQREQMSYDLMLYGFNEDDSYSGNEQYEVYRESETDGSTSSFSRSTTFDDGHLNNHQLHGMLRARYMGETLQASSAVRAHLFHTPINVHSGQVTYKPEILSSTDYTVSLRNRAYNIGYEGQVHWLLPHSNSLTFVPSYGYHHTVRHSEYLEGNHPAIINCAEDTSHTLTGELTYDHSFGDHNRLKLYVRSDYMQSRTGYSGTSNASIYSMSYRLNSGAGYHFGLGKLHAYVGAGAIWERIRVADIRDQFVTPWGDLSLQYAFDDRHSVSMELHHAAWSPSPNDKSPLTIQVSPLLYYTGNPGLRTERTYDLSVRYVGMPSNAWSYSLYGYLGTYHHRYGYVYTPHPTERGILRTIEQPIGHYRNIEWGANTSLRLLDRQLHLMGQLTHRMHANGAPYHTLHQALLWSTQATYYLGDWYCTLYYRSPIAFPDKSRNGYWIYRYSQWYLKVGWASGNWNISAQALNMSRWDWKSYTKSMSTPYYDDTELVLDGQSHALIRLTATYNIGFGKKVDRKDEPQKGHEPISGILRR